MPLLNWSGIRLYISEVHPNGVKFYLVGAFYSPGDFKSPGE
jgi:hypothetical protein